MTDNSANQDAPVTIKKYANRRLYNTATSSYVTLEHLAAMVKDGVEFVVYDAKSGEDITRSVLTQIIMEEESKGDSLLPIAFLRRLIGFYGDSLGTIVPRYLELSMDAFARDQEQMRRRLDDAYGGLFPLKQLEEMGKTNMKMFQSAMEMFTPFAAGGAGRNDGGPAPGDAGNPPAGNDLAELKDKLDAMQRQLDAIAKKDAK